MAKKREVFQCAMSAETQQKLRAVAVAAEKSMSQVIRDYVHKAHARLEAK